MKRTIWFRGATVQQLRQLLQDDSWIGFDEDGENSTIRVVTPSHGVGGDSSIESAPLNEAHLCPPFTDCPH